MRKLIRKHLPNPDALRDKPVFRIFGNSLFHPRLWHINRHSAAGGIAVGLFCGMIPGPLQMLGAAILCVIFRVNLPLALVGTLLSNPLTIVPLYMLAFMIGRFVTGSDASFSPPADPGMPGMGAFLQGWLDWFMSLGKPLFIGLPLLALLLAAVGYFSVNLCWQIHTRRAWRNRPAFKPHSNKPAR